MCVRCCRAAQDDEENIFMSLMLCLRCVHSSARESYMGFGLMQEEMLSVCAYDCKSIMLLTMGDKNFDASTVWWFGIWCMSIRLVFVSTEDVFLCLPGLQSSGWSCEHNGVTFRGCLKWFNWTCVDFFPWRYDEDGSHSSVRQIFWCSSLTLSSLGIWVYMYKVLAWSLRLVTITFFSSDLAMKSLLAMLYVRWLSLMFGILFAMTCFPCIARSGFLLAVKDFMPWCHTMVILTAVASSRVYFEDA